MRWRTRRPESDGLTPTAPLQGRGGLQIVGHRWLKEWRDVEIRKSDLLEIASRDDSDLVILMALGGGGAEMLAGRCPSPQGALYVSAPR